MRERDRERERERGGESDGERDEGGTERDSAAKWRRTEHMCSMIISAVKQYKADGERDRSSGGRWVVLERGRRREGR